MTNEHKAPDDIIYARDLDGAGSAHICAKGDAGSFEYARTDATCAEVKPLVWGHRTCHGYRKGEDNAKSLVGVYSIRKVYMDDWSIWLDERCISDRNFGVRLCFPAAEAKDFAQKHYDVRCHDDVLPYFTTRPASEVRQEGYAKAIEDVVRKLEARAGVWKDHGLPHSAELLLDGMDEIRALKDEVAS